jgi:hypothetical protein
MTLINFFIIYSIILFYYKDYITTFFDFTYISIEICLLYWLLLYKNTVHEEFPISNTNKVNVTPVKLTYSKKMKMFNLVDY